MITHTVEKINHTVVGVYITYFTTFGIVALLIYRRGEVVAIILLTERHADDDSSRGRREGENYLQNP